MEGLSATRAAKMFRGPLRQRMCLGRGLLSDDTLMAAITLQALRRSPDSAEAFADFLARGLKHWFWSLPPGIGLATLKSCLRLSIGIPAGKSGGNSAGNGPIVRAVVLGSAMFDEPDKLRSYIEASTRITHTHPLAIEGSRIAGLATVASITDQQLSFRAEVEKLAPAWPWSVGYPPSGPSGYVVHTVNAALECWERHPTELAATIRMAVALGGDSDSVAAVAGGIVGASLDHHPVPEEWMKWLGWPQPTDLIGLADGIQTKLPRARLHLQHGLTLGVILPHILRRMAPPY